MSSQENQTLIQVPAAFEDSKSLRRFLAILVEKLDIVLGYRGQEQYAKLSDLQTVDTSTLQEQFDEYKTTTDKKLKELESQVQQAAELAFSFTELPVEFRDFDADVWFDLQGYGQFTALGSEITNPPSALVGATSYTVLVTSVLTQEGGAMHEVYIVSDTTKIYHKRAGRDKALTLSLGWF